MLARCFPAPLAALGLILLGGAALSAAQAETSPVLTVNGLGRGLVELGGPWEFHLGDDPGWADPKLNDTPGQSGWETISADEPWGAQRHYAYSGFAWYRRHIDFTPVPGVQQNIALLVPDTGDPYEVYWNGVLVGGYGKLPPHPYQNFRAPPHSWGLGMAGSGVLAFRFWNAPYRFTEEGELGGFYSTPLAGTSDAVTAKLGDYDHVWLRGRQYYFDTNLLFGLISVLSLIAWLRDRRQMLLLWVSLFALSQPLHVALFNAHIPFSFGFAYGFDKVASAFKDISLWYLLLYVLKLDQHPRLRRWTFVLACVSAACGLLGWFVTAADWSGPHAGFYQFAEGALVFPASLIEVYPLVLIPFALKKRLGTASWLVAISAALLEMLGVAQISSIQGIRFTHWTFYDIIEAHVYTLNGNYFDAQNIATALLLVSILYAVYSYSGEQNERQRAMEREFENARAVQQVLVPQANPEVPGFAIESVYKPAGEVGGDFFQILPARDGGVLAVIGDVSGKGMPAAMTVSLLVGTVRTLAHYTEEPGEILVAMNQRMLARSQGGFTTCLVVRAAKDGTLTAASAGHLAPYLDGAEVELEGGLPLGLAAGTRYRESIFQIKPGQQLTMVTDGVAEARGKDGELFGFERTREMSGRSAERIAAAAQAFGQDDDITVLTLTRLTAGQHSSMGLGTPAVARG
jgi:hypothetical protein